MAAEEPGCELALPRASENLDKTFDNSSRPSYWLEFYGITTSFSNLARIDLISSSRGYDQLLSISLRITTAICANAGL